MTRRTESDILGERQLPQEVYWGIHTLRALENFPISGLRWRPQFISALAQVKHACAVTNGDLGYLPMDKAQAIIAACVEMEAGGLHDQVVVDPMQGGAGTSTNMNLNEVLANRANELLGAEKGNYTVVHPLKHVNLHQSTNDVFPTALKVAGLGLLKELETALSRLQEILQQKEQEFADIVKVARTQLCDAVPMTLGMEFGAYAEAMARDRWRVFKCRERIKQVNLGGTAVGTGLGAPREFILRAAENLKSISGLPISRAENLVDATQNMDCFAEVMGILSACAANLMKVANDLRLLASGPDCGLGEIELPPLQAGSSVMAGKINPVMPEAVVQAALRVMAANHCVCACAGMGQLELNPFAPLLAHEFLEALAILRNVVDLFAEKCVSGITAQVDRCRELAEKSKVLATALVPALGYEAVERIVHQARSQGRTVAEVVVSMGVADEKTVAEMLSPQRMRKLGFSSVEFAALRLEKTGGDQ